MTLTSTLALFGAMVVLAIIPGPGVFAVVARTLAADFRQGFAITVGIVIGDFVFITLALVGLTALFEFMGGLFAIVKYIGAAYLFWLGTSLLVAKKADTEVKPKTETSYLASIVAGLLVTLSNPKAILFYFSFFPAFVDLGNLSLLDATIIYAIATIAVGGVMLVYAYAFHQAKLSARLSMGESSRVGQWLRYGAGALLISSGVLVVART